jgi:hypothetical protein
MNFMAGSRVLVDEIPASSLIPSVSRAARVQIDTLPKILVLISAGRRPPCFLVVFETVDRHFAKKAAAHARIFMSYDGKHLPKSSNSRG